MALSLAKQLNRPLLTGDMALRKVAEEEMVLVHGTIWMFERLIRYQCISKDWALVALKQMQIKDRILPFEKTEKQIRNF